VDYKLGLFSLNAASPSATTLFGMCVLLTVTGERGLVSALEASRTYVESHARTTYVCVDPYTCARNCLIARSVLDWHVAIGGSC